MTVDPAAILAKIINCDGYVNLGMGIIDISGGVYLQDFLTEAEMDYLRDLQQRED